MTARAARLGLAVLIATPLARGQTAPVPAQPIPALSGPAPGERPRRPDEDVHRARRMLAEILGLAAGLAAGGIVGGGLGCLANTRDCALGAAEGAVAVAIFTAPLGVFTAGSLMRGNGGYGWTLLGGVAGFGLGLALAAPINNSTAQAVLLSFFPIVGMIASYEVTSDGVAPRESPTMGTSVLPALALTSTGGTFGAAGTF